VLVCVHLVGRAGRALEAKVDGISGGAGG